MKGLGNILGSHGTPVTSLVAMMLVSCGGSSDSGTVPPTPPPAPPPANSGPIMQVGLIWAPVSDGGWYFLDSQPELYVSASADINIDGSRISPTSLSMDEGEVVRIAGTAGQNSGGYDILTANTVRITHMVDGPVDAIDAEHGILTVLGQEVLANDRPGLNSIGNGAFKVGDRVRVSGHPSESGEIVSTLISLSTLTGDFLASGIVHSPDPARKHFMLNRIVVDFGSAQLPNLPAGGPTEGERVMVWGTRAPGTSSLVATSVQDDSEPQAGAWDYGDARTYIHGIVTSTGASLTVDGLVVKLGPTGNCTATPLPDADVTLSGFLDPGNVITTDSFCYTNKSPDPLGLVQGPIDSIDPVFGTLSILGFQIQPSISTHIVDTAGTAIPPSALKPGDVVIAGGTAPVNAPLFAGTIGQFSADTFSMIRAWDYNVTLAEPIVYLYGRAITTDSNTLYYWINNSNHAITPLGDPTRFWSGSKNWPFWDKICRPDVAITVLPQSDGSLKATNIVIEPDYC